MNQRYKYYKVDLYSDRWGEWKDCNIGHARLQNAKKDGEEATKSFLDELKTNTGIELNANTKTIFWRNMYRTMGCFYDYEESQVLMCVNKGDILIFDNPIKFAFSADKFGINNHNDQHFMKDIKISSGYILFLTSKGDIFTLGLNDDGQCGVSIDEMKSIEHDREENRLTMPYQPMSLRSKFIIDIYVGDEYSLCVDRDKNVYCWGNND